MHKLLFAFLLPLAEISYCQESTNREWYILSRNRVLEFTVTDDSLINRQLGWDLIPRINARNYRQAKPIDSLKTIADRLYIFMHSEKKDSLKKVVGYWLPSKAHKNLFVLKWDTLVNSQSIIGIPLNRTDTAEIAFPLFLSKAEMERIRSLKSIDDLTVADLKKYVALNLQIRKNIANNEQRGGSTGDDLYYIYFMMRYIFSDIGYNPMYTDEQFERVFKKFSANPATKALIEQLSE